MDNKFQAVGIQFDGSDDLGCTPIWLNIFPAAILNSLRFFSAFLKFKALGFALLLIFCQSMHSAHASCASSNVCIVSPLPSKITANAEMTVKWYAPGNF